MRNLLILFIILGCAQTFEKIRYDVALYEVERPIYAKERYGEKEIKKITEKEVTKYSYEDDMIKILWIIELDRLSFILENKTDHSIKIIWDEAIFVDENGLSNRIIHSGVKYIDRDKSLPPSVVIRKGTLIDMIVPVDKIYYSDLYSGWKIQPLIPVPDYDNIEVSKNLAKENIGKIIQVLLPLEIENVINEYIFMFKISDIL